jgi:hypothetical protein
VSDGPTGQDGVPFRIGCAQPDLAELALQLIMPDSSGSAVVPAEREACIGDAGEGGRARNAAADRGPERLLDQYACSEVEISGILHVATLLVVCVPGQTDPIALVTLRITWFGCPRSTLGRPAVSPLLGIMIQRLLDRVGQSQAAVVRESVEPRLPVSRALQRHDRLTRRSVTLGTPWLSSFQLRHRVFRPNHEMGTRRFRPFRRFIGHLKQIKNKDKQEISKLLIFSKMGSFT